MIAYLRGRVRDVQPTSVVLDVGGVGYLVHVAPSLSEQLKADDGANVELFIATIVREDAITLHGFSSPQQREVFELLREVKGVGPRMAQAILGTLSIGQLVTALQQDNELALVGVPGVGRKTAGRLLLELKGKIPAHFQADPEATAAGISARKAAPDDQLPLALSQLGYRKSEIDVVLGSADVPALGEAPIEQRLSAALRVLQRQ